MEKTIEIGSTRDDASSVTLIPRPSDDPRDPLLWKKSKKYAMLAVLVFAIFSAYSAPSAAQANIKQQSSLYHKTTTEISYGGSAATAGLAVGGLFFNPVAHRLGRPSVIFWGLLAGLACQVWASQCIGKYDYNSFVLSRFFCGFFGSSSGVVAPRLLVDMFYLHQRGRAFTILHQGLNWGVVVAPTFSALVSAEAYWPVEFWWSVACLGTSALLMLLFVYETCFIREPGAVNIVQPEGFIANRIATYFPGYKVMPQTSWKETGKVALLPFKIGLSPVTLCVAAFTMFSFGWFPASNTLTPVYLQEPVKKGGYGFTVAENAYFTFNHWVGLSFALLYGYFVSDRLPLYLAARRGGIWKPEYRLHALWFPSLIVLPIGWGLFGASLQYRLNWGLLAFGHFLATFGSMTVIPVSVNYIFECFTRYPAEGSIVLNFYRLAFGLTLPFYVDQWADAVTIGWVWGMAAILCIVSFAFCILLMFKGHTIRQYTIARLSTTEEGEKVVQSKGHGA